MTRTSHLENGDGRVGQILRVGTMNVTPRGAHALERFMEAVDIGVLQETGQVVPRVREAARETGRKLIMADEPGADSTPAFYNPRTVPLERPLWLPALTAADGPYINKAKGWQGGRFRLDTEPRRFLDVLGGHLPYNQDDSEAQRRAADKMAGRLVDYADGRDVGTVALADWNERPTRVPYLRQKGWKCDQLELRNLPTHHNWTPDHGWARSTDRVRIEFLRHEAIETRGDHDALVIVLRIMPRLEDD